MPLSSIGDGAVHNGGGGSFAKVGFTTDLILPYLERLFVGLHIFFKHSDDLLRVRMIFFACVYFIKGAEAIGSVIVRQAAADTDMT